jgi:hypothetical protein
MDKGLTRLKIFSAATLGFLFDIGAGFTYTVGFVRDCIAL